MKKTFLKSAVLAIAGVGLMAGSANANLYVDSYTPNGVVEWFETVSWTFDITDSFDPFNEVVIGATIALNLDDDGDGDFLPEFAFLNVGSNYNVWQVETGIKYIELTSLGNLSDGMVDASLTSVFGDFQFNLVTLTVETVTVDAPGPGTAGAPVPEPATMLLFGTGLVGLAGAARRKKAQKK